MHTSGIQAAPIGHKGEARLALAFPYEKQRVARVRSLPGARWSQSRKCWHVPATETAAQLLSDRLPDLIVFPDSLKPVSRTGLSSEASDNAGINTHSTAAKGRLWHKVDITPAHEAGRAQVLLTGAKLAVRVLSDVAMYPYQPANYSKNPQSSRRAFLRKVRQKWGKCADITKLSQTKKEKIRYNMKTAQEIRQELEKTGFVWIKSGGRDYFERITKELGEVIFVTDVKVNPESRALVTSEKGLDFHTDHHKANFIAWYCIEQTDEGGESILQDANKVFELLTEKEQEELRKVRLFEHKVFEDDEDTYPFIIEENGKREFYYSFWLAKENISERQKEIIRKYQKLTNETEFIKIKINPTDVLIIDNHRVLHGRTAIEGSKNRFLKRFWIKSFHN